MKRRKFQVIFSSMPFDSELATAETSSRQMPFGYFRTFNFQPYLAYSSPSPAYSNYYNPLTNWPAEYLPSPPIPAPNFYGSFAPFSTTHKPSPSTSAQPSLLNFQTLFKSLSASASDLLLNSAPASSTTTSTPQPTTTSSTTTTPSTTSSTTTTTTTTTELPTTSASANSLDHTIPLVVNRLDDDGDSRSRHSQFGRVPILNRRSDTSPPWNRQAYPISDALIQQYFASFLAAPHVHLVPCMCPMSLAMPPLAAMPDFSGPSSRSDDFDDVENETMDGVTDDQSIVNKLIE